MSESKPEIQRFSELNLPASLMKALDEVGYENPSPIQVQAIPILMNGQDLLGHAPTGTGKTAAFALPLIAGIDINATGVQVITLCPTRELAIQVAEAFRRYASHVEGFRVLPVYGGQDYAGQVRQLKRGVHVVVGTPGRVMDHMRKGVLKLDALNAVVLDEADEMLRMGFIEEVEWILEHTPPKRQMALFSATMPAQVQRIANHHLHNPQSVSIHSKTATAETIRQRYWLVRGVHKLDALTRILEVDPFDAALIFVRTRTATTELAERLEARGYAAAAMNGDMAQKSREQTVERLKKGSLDIVVATDVAARGLDVDRITLVVNYDIPYDTEAYIHRIGRTGRAGRRGEAVLFVAPREQRMLGNIERATKSKIEQLELPSTEMVSNRRIAAFKQKITDTLAAGELAFMQSLVNQYSQEHDVPAAEIAAALASMVVGDKPLQLDADKSMPKPAKRERAEKGQDRDKGGERKGRLPAEDSERFRIEVGHDHGVKPGNIVGAIANEAGLDGQHIGRIEIEATYTLIDLPVGMPREIFNDLQKTRVCGQALKISRLTGARPAKTKGPANTPPDKPKSKRRAPSSDKRKGKKRKKTRP